MKAVEFVKKFGWDEAKEIVDGLPEKFKFKPIGGVCWDNNTYKYSDRFKPRSSLVNMADLKTLVEAKESVDSYGGLEKANKDVKTASFLWGEPPFKYDELQKAINLVESVENA